jgi:import receptor subunit TOM20
MFKIGKEKKRVGKTIASTKESGNSSSISTEELRAALETVRNEEVPKTVDAKEHYFMSQVGLGEQLALQGSSQIS